MGFFSSIFKPVKKLFGGAGKVLFGEKDKVQWTDPRKMIAPASPQEKALLGKLYPYGMTSLSRANTLGNMTWNSGLLGQAFNTHKNLYDQTMGNLQSIAGGNLPDPYKRAVESTFKTQLGDILNQTAKRGIVNSSITQRAINDALTKAMDMQVNYLPVAAQMTTLPYTFGTTKPLGLFGSMRELEKDYLSYPSNLWNTLMTARYGLRATPIVQKGNAGLLGALSAAGGAAIGGMAGGPQGAMIGGQLGGALGSSLSASFR
ncbi:hypothetical protein [Persephonella sp.]